jgi:SAM-dependent methyltransferase
MSVRVDDPRLLACVEDGPPDIGTLWELCMHFEFAREVTASGIADWLGPPDQRRILDSACGSGFPALELIAMGYDITCADGSELMLRHFRRNARLEGLTVEPVQLWWEEMPARFGDSYDIVINRGGGNYKYAGAWDVERLPDRLAMREAISQWVRCLRPGGTLYIDFARESELEHLRPEVSTHPTLLIGDHRVDIVEQITVDHEAKVRYWHSELTIDGQRHEFQRRSHCLSREEFTTTLAGCGLTGIEQIAIKGEHYDVYSATRKKEG